MRTRERFLGLLSTLSKHQSVTNIHAANHDLIVTKSSSESVSQKSPGGGIFECPLDTSQSQQELLNNLNAESVKLQATPPPPPPPPPLPQQPTVQLKTHASTSSLSSHSTSSRSSFIASPGKRVDIDDSAASRSKTAHVPINIQTKSIENVSIDDHNFINNTFSFLDDLDNQDEFDSKEFNSRKETEEFENFPWHAIYPSKDESKVNERSKTLSHEPSYDETSIAAKGIGFLKGFSSKMKPIAPKIKSSLTIGVATGAEALKAINILAKSNSNNDLSTSSTKLYSTNHKLLQEIKKQQMIEQQEVDLLRRTTRSDSLGKNASPGKSLAPRATFFTLNK